MLDWNKKRVLITVRTYPVPSAKNIEASCTGGITPDGQWMRLFPVPYRLMDEDKRFKKWQWIDVSTTKATGDSRPESFRINPDSIMIGETVGSANGWIQRRELMEPLRRQSMCRIQRERDECGAPTLGFFRPFEIKRLLIEPSDHAQWSENQLGNPETKYAFSESTRATFGEDSVLNSDTSFGAVTLIAKATR